MPPKNGARNKVTKAKDGLADQDAAKFTRAVKNYQAAGKSAPTAAETLAAPPSFSLTQPPHTPANVHQEELTTIGDDQDMDDTTDDEYDSEPEDTQHQQQSQLQLLTPHPHAQAQAQQAVDTTVSLPLHLLNLSNDSNCQKAIAALSDSTKATQRGLSLVESIFAEYQATHEKAPEPEKRLAIRTLAHSETLLLFTRSLNNTTETVKACVQMVASQAQAQQVHASKNKEQDDDSLPEVPNHLYEIRMKKIADKVPETYNVIQIFEQATANVNLSVIDYSDRGGNGHFKVSNKTHAENATKALKDSKYDDVNLASLYDISFGIVSSSSIRLIKMQTAHIKSHIIWINDQLEVDHDLAADIMVRRNNDWCKSKADIQFIQLNTLPKAYKVIQLFISTAAHDRLMILGRKAFKINLGNGITAQAFIDARETVCLKCLDFGHTLPSCRKSDICRRCTGPHPSGGCKVDPPKCIRCIKHNQRNPDDFRATDHEALDYSCPEVKQQRDVAWTLRREAAFKRNGRN